MYNIINTARIHYIQAPSVLSVSLTFSLSYVFIYILLVSLPSFPLYPAFNAMLGESPDCVFVPRFICPTRAKLARKLRGATSNRTNPFERQVRWNTLRSANTELDRGRIFHSASIESCYCPSPCSWEMRNVRHYRHFNGILSNVFEEEQWIDNKYQRID